MPLVMSTSITFRIMNGRIDAESILQRRERSLLLVLCVENGTRERIGLKFSVDNVSKIE